MNLRNNIKIILILFVGLYLFNCSSSKNINSRFIITNSELNAVYNDTIWDGKVQIVKLETVKVNDTTFLNELRIHDVQSAMYSKKYMYDKYGKWDEETYINNERHPILIWNNIKLFKEKDDLYSIAANGDENQKEMYSSIIVFDENGKDCFEKNYKNNKELITLFYRGIHKNNKENKYFFQKYSNVIRNF